MEFQGRPGSGAFQWNRGGWFGAQFGATLWLAILGCVLLAQSKPVGGVLVLWGVVPNLVGFVLWHRRHSVPPYPAIQILLAACGACALFAMLSIRSSGLMLSTVGLPSGWFLLMYPGLMLSFHLQETAARKARRADSSHAAPR